VVPFGGVGCVHHFVLRTPKHHSVGAIAHKQKWTPGELAPAFAGEPGRAHFASGPYASPFGPEGHLAGHQR
jgi:hypothetical protein